MGIKDKPKGPPFAARAGSGRGPPPPLPLPRAAPSLPLCTKWPGLGCASNSRLHPALLLLLLLLIPASCFLLRAPWLDYWLLHLPPNSERPSVDPASPKSQKKTGAATRGPPA
jgi:hypothetical protein